MDPSLMRPIGGSLERRPPDSADSCGSRGFPERIPGGPRVRMPGGPRSIPVTNRSIRSQLTFRRDSPMDLNRRQMLFAAGAALIGSGSMSRVLAARQGKSEEGPLLHQELGLPPLGHHREGEQALPRRTDPDRDRQGARLRGRRHQGRPAVRPRQDRPVGRVRLLDDRRPDRPQAPTRRRRCRRTGRRPSSTPSAKARASSACTAPPTPSTVRRTDALDPYIEMIGGEFIVHGDQQESRLLVVDPAFPGAASLRLVVRDQRRVVRPQELPRRPPRDHGPGHRDHGEDQGGTRPTTGRTSPRPGPACTARAGSSTPRWATAKTSGKTRCTRAS